VVKTVNWTISENPVRKFLTEIEWPSTTLENSVRTVAAAAEILSAKLSVRADY
jgi:hypothetical protein